MTAWQPLSIALLLVCASATATAGDTPPPAAPEAGADAAASPSSESSDDGAAGDPTQPSEDLRRALAPRGGVSDGGAARPAAPRMPVIRLRAHVIVRDRPPVAMVEIDDALYTIHPGVRFVVAASGGPVTLSVERLDANGVVLRLVDTDQELLLR